MPGLEFPIDGCRYYGKARTITNNVVEYLAALDCLRAIYRTGYRGAVVLQGDSQVVVKQLTGEWSCLTPHLQDRLDQLRKAATFFASLELRWIPREQNQRADLLSRIAYEQATGSKPPERRRRRA